MDKIIVTSADITKLLEWRDNNTELVRMHPAPFKGIILQFPDTNIEIKTITDAQRVTFYTKTNGTPRGKIIAERMPGGFYRTTKNETPFEREDIQSIITVYASLMALITYHTPTERDAAPPQNKTHTPQKKQQKKKSRPAVTYLLKQSSSGLHVSPRGSHASPAHAFNVRGHYRRYKSGRVVWIAPYTKGTKQAQPKTYKL